MKRTTVYLTDAQASGLQKESERTELKVSEMIRRAIDEYLEKQRKELHDTQPNLRPSGNSA